MWERLTLVPTTLLQPPGQGTCSWSMVTTWKGFPWARRCARGLRNWTSCEAMEMDMEACSCTSSGSPPSKVPRRFR